MVGKASKRAYAIRCLSGRVCTSSSLFGVVLGNKLHLPHATTSEDISGHGLGKDDVVRIIQEVRDSFQEFQLSTTKFFIVMEGKAQVLRVAIVGAGIGGLTLSSTLEFLKVGSQVKIDIYEASPHISQVGAGINMWRRTWEIIKSIGLEDTLLKFLPRPPDDISRTVFHVRKSDQLDGFHIKDLMMKGGAIRFHRADLQQALTNGLSDRLHLSHRLVSYKEVGDEIHLTFQDGSSATCDLLIGIDGIKSVVRKCFLEKQGLLFSPSVNPVWTGTYAYRGLIPADELEKEFPGHRAMIMPVMYVGKLKHLVVYPVSQDSLINIVACTTDLSKEGTVFEGSSTTISTRELLCVFEGWEEEVQALLRCIKQPTKWAIPTVNPLDRYASGRVILAGDAAHGMSPHQGAGAGQAIEDAYILASLIAASGGQRDLIPEISRIYNDIRCPAGNKVLEASRESGLFCELVAPGFEDVVEGDTTLPLNKLKKLFDDVEEGWRWASESAESVREQAVMMLGQSPVLAARSIVDGMQSGHSNSDPTVALSPLPSCSGHGC